MMRSPLFLAFALAIGSAGALLSTDAAAQSTRAVRATAEASMVLTGNIDVAADGAVSGLGGFDRFFFQALGSLFG